MTEAGDVDHRFEVLSGSFANVFQMVLGFGASVVIARLLDPVVFGMYFFLLSIITLVDGPVTGWAEAGKKRFSEVDSPRGEILGAVLLALGIAGLVYGAGFLMFGQYIPGTEDRRIPALLAILFPFHVGSRIVLKLYTSTGRVGTKMWIEFGRDIVKTTVQVGLVILGFEVAGMIGGLILATAIVFPVTLFVLRIRPEIPTKETLLSIWAFAKYSMPNGLVAKTASSFDKLLLGFVFTTGVVGLYEVSAKLAIPALLLTTTISSGLMARVSNLNSRGVAISPHISRNLSFSSVLAIPMFFGALVLAETIVVTVFSSDYSGAGPFLVWLSLAKIFQTQNSPLSSVIQGLDMAREVMYISTVTTAFNIAFGVLLIYAIGPVGIAIATAVTYLVRWTFTSVVIRRNVSDPTILTRPFFEQILSGVVMAGTIYSFVELFGLSGYVEVFLTIGLGAMVYFGLLVSLSRETRRAIFAVAPKPLTTIFDNR